MNFKPTDYALFFDGECGLCQFCVRLIIRFDRTNRIKYGMLQNIEYKEYMNFKGLDYTGTTSVVLVRENPITGKSEALLKSSAVIAALECCSKGGKIVALGIRFWPRPIRDLGYDGFALVRRALFSRRVTFVIPKALQLKTHAT